MSAPPVLLASAVSGRLFERAAAEARRRFPDAPLVALVHWRATGALPDDVRPYVATDYRDRPAALVHELRRLRPVATVVVCDGAPGASATFETLRWPADGVALPRVVVVPGVSATAPFGLTPPAVVWV